MSGALVIGESLIDVVNDEAHRGEHPGDSPMNVAITISRAGANTAHRRIRVTEDSSPPRQCLRDWHHEGELPLDL